MEPHYRTALGEMTLAGEEDDLAELFPLMAAGATVAAIRPTGPNVSWVATGRAGPSSGHTASPSAGPDWPSGPTSAPAAACA